MFAYRWRILWAQAAATSDVKGADGMDTRVDNTERVRALVGRLVRQARGGLLKTQLVKFLYLIDLEWVKATGVSLTGLRWRYHYYGPWDDAIDGVLLEMEREGELVVREGIRPDGLPYRVYDATGTTPGDNLSAAERLVSDHICRTYRRFRVRQLLDDVVYETPPMLNANKGEELNLTLAHRYDEDLTFLVGGWAWGPEG
ncbi:MAG: SocA family protein [Firmicutes bacterium]|nr:SocA family protein [Bacillota bacterium]